MRQLNTNSLQPVIDEGENAMDMVDSRKKESAISFVINQPVYLWLDQNFRKIQGKPLLQVEVLEKIADQVQEDENLLAILLFGSVASDTHTWNSDIDLILVYKTHEPPSGLINLFVDGIEVQYFFTTFDTLVQNQETVPYLLDMLCDAKILFDRNGSISPVVDQIDKYFAAHPEIKEEWMRFKDLHQVEKKGPECAQTTIFQRWDELEDKYSDGVRKRTFFRT